MEPARAQKIRTTKFDPLAQKFRSTFFGYDQTCRDSYSTIMATQEMPTFKLVLGELLLPSPSRSNQLDPVSKKKLSTIFIDEISFLFPSLCLGTSILLGA